MNECDFGWNFHVLSERRWTQRNNAFDEWIDRFRMVVMMRVLRDDDNNEESIYLPDVFVCVNHLADGETSLVVIDAKESDVYTD